MIRRLALTAVVGLVGIVVGVALTLLLQEPPADEPSLADPPRDGSGVTVPSSELTTSSIIEKHEAPASEQVLLVWTPGGLPDGFATAVSSLSDVTSLTVVRSDLVHLTRSRQNQVVVDEVDLGYVVPIETMAFDPSSYWSFVNSKDRSLFTTLGDNEVLLGKTSAAIRGLKSGATVELDGGASLLVAGIVDDVLIGGAEFAVTQVVAEQLGVTTERYLLIHHVGTRADVEKAINSHLPDGTAVRIRAPGETPILRHGDAVLAQVFIKQEFGEFAYRPNGSGGFEIAPAWLKANIVTEEVPLLGRVTCHRNLIPTLAGAMDELSKSNLAFLIDRDGFAGCFNARFIANRSDISRHSWGAAIDLNMGSNLRGVESAQDPRLLAVMEEWGFTSGHDWLIPDPGHFEFLAPAS